VESLPGSLAGIPFKKFPIKEEDYVMKIISMFGA
jgi:hypothetical protein